ncbi:MAG: purine-nucleoside phosphorylase [Bacteroidales bacterium]|nr:purine-nucleoside phosphorylase [Bacteroidales bacterium]MDD3152204.1 purine-nucleoside phosphorylase [Bacteroidales bacterium]MDD3914138.1 purine-nucleoside phosphorylase [Bacteroidales bacterium]MDD4634090.1 purine-nucleoside phosphorylase [Bacteroidales bacterium]
MSIYSETADYIAKKIGTIPDTAIILGSGLGRLADEITDKVVIPYTEIPHFIRSTAPGHKGNLIFGKIEGKYVLAMQGRFHFYEGYSMEQVTYPIRVFAKLGIKKMFVTNAAGGINTEYIPGDLMLIKDHICLMPNPLIGKNLEEFGPRFPDMTMPYDKELRLSAHRIADELKIKLYDGVYLGLTGPTYETVSEIKFFRMIGADAVGMSTVPEVIVARHCGIRVFGMSVITNKATSEDSTTKNDGNEVLIEADKAASKMMNIVKKLLKQN